MKLTCILTLIAILAGSNQKLLAGLSAGAAQVDITPRKLPVTVNGGFLTNKVRIIADRLHSRAIVFSDNEELRYVSRKDDVVIFPNSSYKLDIDLIYEDCQFLIIHLKKYS